MVASGDKTITVSVPTEHTHLNLTQLSTTALNTPILPSCPQIAPDLVARWISGASSADDAVLVLTALARDVSVCPGIQTLCSHFVAKMGFMEMLKVPQSDEQTQAILLAFYRLVSFDRETYGALVDKEVVSGLMSAFDMAKQLLYKVFEMTKCDADLEYSESERVLALARDLLPTTHIEVPISTLNSLNTPIGSSLIPRLGGPSPVASDYVETETSLQIMNELGLALSTSAPILLSGPSGSGKTFYVNEIARNLSKLDNMVRIHLGDQTDSKLLIGAYTTGSKPGSFEWRDGVLTTAIKEGRWVLVEDIDRAPTDVVSVLLSLLEKRELVIPSRDEVIKAHAGFRLVGTMRKKAGAHTNEIIGLRLWQQVELPELQPEEIVTIIKERYHVISAMAESFQDTFAAIVALYGSSSFVSLTKSAVSRVVSLNDLIKLCNRVSSMITRLGYTSPNDPLPNHVYEFIFLEALDCFAGFLSNSDARMKAAHVIGECLGMSAPKVDVLLGRVPAYQDSSDSLEVGRSLLTKQVSGQKKKSNSLFANTNHASKLMEQICVAIASTEPLLLVGETGTGKTTVVQNVASLMNKKLTVVNVSQQTEAGDLLGGFKPVDVSMIAVPLMDEFQEVFSATFSAKKNVEFMKLLTRAFNVRHWKNCIRLWKEAVKLSAGRLKESSEGGKRRKLTDKETVSLQASWDQFQSNLTAFEIQYKQIQSSFVFQFIEGSIVQAVRKGEWVLLDEINLASPDTLEAISDLLSEPRTLLLSEKGDAETIVAHPDFRLFACMNPATDVGKRDLPLGLRSRFTELYVSSPDENFDDLLKIIDRYIGHLCVSDSTIGIHNDVADLYLTAKRLSAENKIVDGAGQKPHFSIRTLSRTLVYVSQIAHLFGPRGLRRSLYEGFCMSFLTLLDAASEAALHEVIKKYTINKLKDQKSIMTQKTKAPSDKHVAFEHYWLEPGPLEPFDDEKYVMTPFVTKNLLNLVRATSGKSSVLIQGPTSAGKTSMIRYLAQKTGHEFVRINNHEHTDLQEYLGTYVADSEGKLKFKEGVLVQALRRGAWIVLDELNLAPTDVLEALNRLLDDNRELLIPETQEVVRPHPQFRLFATQNPPGLYGGRKQLSRAFRNRFLELHFGDIPENELEHILHKRALIAPSQAAKIVNVYRELSLVRQASRVFEQNAFATLRDLFRWAGRNCDNNEELAMNGFLLLGERVRNPEEREVVKRAIEKVMKVKLDERELYDHVTVPGVESGSSVVMTNGLRRLVYLVQEAIKHKEPILLVGETGCGKTTVCQLLAEARNKELHIVNAHQNMETGDIIGSFRPVRNRSDLESRFREVLLEALAGDASDEEFGDVQKLSNAELDAKYLSLLKKDPESFPEEIKQAVVTSRAAQKTLFTWSDGSLIQALKQGDFFLLDEISLADDSVLERLNSVLEPERTLLLAEKGSDASEASVTALPDFQFFATMNPGGDYGKKELSLALRNRFTEIWVPSMEDFNDVETIVGSRLSEKKKQLSKVVTEFSKWFAIKYSGSTTSGIISLRNLLAWTEFINKFAGSNEVALLHGALMVFIDALGTGQTSYLTNLEAEKRECIAKLQSLLSSRKKDVNKLLTIYDETPEIVDTSSELKIGHFEVAKESENASSAAVEKASFNLSAPTTRLNAMRVLRSLQVPKPILLEGSPGVGKTSLITSIAQLLGKPLTRINLSEQTDLIDLFGSDAPAEDSEAGTFVWRDAPFLRAMQAGEWVLLDEMNLASQSVLEGLNACLDHRGQTYIPELDKFFTCAPGFTVFAAQNPQHQGGGRKGLPKSFLNRFTVVYVDALDKEDLFQIAQYLYPKVDDSSRMISFISQLDRAVQSGQFGAKGAPWEFNMRDTMRWMSLVSRDVDEEVDPGSFLNLIAGDRFRTVADRLQLEELYRQVFGKPSQSRDYCVTVKSTEEIRCGRASLSRDQLIQPSYSSSPLSFLHCNSSPSETLIRAINHSWPVILAGPSCSGKTSLIRLMASVAGATLDEIALNADVDSVDLVGGYEQVDNRQKREQLEKKIGHVFQEWGRRELARGNEQGLSRALAHKADTSMDQDLQNQISHLYDELDLLSKSKNASDAVSFQWIDGILVNAVAQGHWLVLDNANLCSASVLDRLNSLLEPNGTLILNESALEDGSPRVISPHKNFRIFLTVNPKYGELSRAMRNRAVEIHVDELDVRMSEFDRVRLQETAGGAPVQQSHVLTWRRALTEVQGGGDSSIVSEVALKYLSWPLATSDFAGLISSTDAPAAAKELANHVMSLSAQVGVDRFVSLLKQLPLDDHVTPVDAFLDPSLDPDLVKLGELAPVLALLVRFSKTSQNLSVAASNGENNKASTLTYLEKSAAAVSGRRMKDAAAPGLFQLLVGASDVVQKVLEKVLGGAVVEEEVFTHLLSLLTLADQIYINTSTQSPVESQFHVYADWFEEWIRSARGVELTPLTKALALFDSQISLSRGLVMRQVWETLCPSVPSTLAGWLTFEKVAALCERFDDICSQMPATSIETVLTVKAQFAGFLEAAGDDNEAITEEFYSTLVKTVDSMEEVEVKAEEEQDDKEEQVVEKKKIRDNTYVSLFSDLAAAFELSGVKHRNLSFYACLPTREESLLEKLTKHGNGFELTSPDHLAGEYVSAAQKFGFTKNGAVEQTRGDYAYVGKLLAGDNSAILADKLPAFVSVLTATLGDLEEVGNSVTGTAVEALEQCMVGLKDVPALLSEQTVSSVGSAYISVFKAALDMYVPNLPYDPAIKEYVDYDMQVRVDNLHRASHNVDQKMQQVFFGTAVEEYTSETAALFKPRVFRDSSTSIDLMIREWNQFMVVLDQVVEKVANVTEESKSTILQELDLFQKNTQQFLVRLKHSYPRYTDLCSILDRFVSGFRLGVFMMQSALEGGRVDEWTTNALTLSSTVALSATLDNLVKYCNDKSVEDLDVEKTLSFVMDVVSKQGNSDKALVAYCCTTIFARWTLRRLRMEEQAAIESSGFSTNLDETAEEEFSKLFPDYEIKLDEAGNVIKPKVTKQDVDYSAWLKSYERVFGGLEEPLSHVILKGAGLAGDGKIGHVMPSLLQSHVTVLETDCIDVSEASPTFDFYRQHSAAETQKCVGVATKLLKFVNGLLAKWPEHDTLQQIAFQCNELLSFSVVTPVARLLAKVEQIYTFLHEWEKLASRDVSVREYIDIFTSLIVSWRRLELAMWPKLFDFEEEAQKDGLGQWWFNVYEAVVVVCRDNEELSRDDITQLVQTLNLFLSQSTIGQYGFRLELLEAVLKHIGSMEASISVAQVTTALKAFLVYYKMFIPAIQTHVAARKKTLQKDIQEVILLASWKDTNVHALKESARKSHRKLFKVVKKYRTLLCEPVKSVLEGGMQDSGVTASIMSAVAPGVADLTESLSLYTPTFVPDAQKTLNILTKRIANLDQIESVSLMDIVSDIQEESARLKKATPNHVTEDNKKEIGALRVEKQRFLSETLKELRSHGFKGRITAETLESQGSLSSVLGNLVVSEKRDQSYFLRLIDSFSKLRSACANPSGDVPLQDISVAAAMAENILRMCIKENNVIGGVETAAKEIGDVGKKLEAVSTDVAVSFVDGDSVTRFLTGLKSVITVIIESATNMLRLDGKLGSGVAQITTLCNDFEAKFVTLLHSFNSVKHLMDWKKPTGETSKLVEEIQSTVALFQSKLVKIGKSHSYFQYASSLVASFVALEDVSGDELEGDDDGETMEAVEKLCKTILVVVQGVIKRVSDDVGEDDDSDSVSFSRDYQLLVNLAQLLHSDRILRQTRETIDHVPHTAAGSAALGVLRAYLQQYVYMCDLVCCKVQAQFADLTKGGFLLCKALYNLATNGFCSPEEEQDQEQDSNATASGTGLGDGSGAQDHSGDVGEDENLDDYMEQENEDQEDRDDDEDDDAVSVEGDMAGKSENAKDEEEKEGEDGEEEQEEEEEDIDDETGNLDDLDPNAMDDKMWNDDEEVQDEKEKDGDVDGDDKDDGGEEGKQDDGKQQGEEGEAETKEGDEEEGEQEGEEKEGDGDEGDKEEDGDEDDSDGESVDAQEDDVRNKQDGEELDPHLEESEVLELPDDMNLDGMDEEKEEGEDEFDDGLDKDMDEEDGDEEEEDVDMEEDLQAGEEDPEEGAEEEEVDEGAGEVTSDVEDADEKNPDEEDNVKEDAMEVDQQDDDKAGEHNEEAPDMEMEGLHGQDDAGDQEENDESAVKQETGEKGAGQDADSKEEENDVGGGGETGAKEEKEDEEEEADMEQDGKDQDGEEDTRVDQMKQLGDALKEFHKKKEEIKNSNNDPAAQQDDVDSANVDPQEFEHVDGPDSKHDTQAMGAADRDVKQEIDDDMAMDNEQEEVKPERRNVKEEQEESGDQPEEGAEEEDDGGAPEGAASKTAVDGEAEEDDEEADSKVQGEMMDVDSDEEEIEEVEEEIEDLSIQDEQNAMSLSESRDKWKTYQSSVADLATTLCEQLRLILEPTLATKMRGDFKTGKRLNMKRIIPYIASSFKKDKIWMRRTKPSKRQYQIMISVDDSKSMNESPQCVELAFQSIALISKALTQLESGQLAVMKFGQDAQLVHPFEKTFSDESGGELVSKFSFAQDQTNVQKLVSNSIDIFQQQKMGGAELWQLQIIISDGICENHEVLKQLVRHARELKIMLVFVVIDALAAASGSSSITDIKQAKYISQDDGQMVLKMEKYLDTFPFEFYVIVRDIKELPSVLSSVLRQFYSEVAEMS